MPTISLTALKVRTAAPGEYRDMGVPGLWLIVSPAKNHARRWSVVGRDKDGIQRRAKLGAYPEVTLADARIAASLKIEEIKKSRGGPKPKPLPGTALVPAAEQKPETIAAALAKFIDRHKGDYRENLIQEPARSVQQSRVTSMGRPAVEGRGPGHAV